MNFPHPAGLRPPCAPAVLVAAMLLALTGTARAAPLGGVVAAGSAAISTKGTQTTITQGSGSAVINWQASASRPVKRCSSSNRAAAR